MKRNILSILLLCGLGTIVQANPQTWLSSDSRSFNCGQIILIAAQAETGYEFTQWNDGNKDNPRTITASNDKTYIAQFKQSSATTIDDVNETAPKARKVLIEDKLLIILDDRVYDTTGKRVR